MAKQKALNFLRIGNSFPLDFRVVAEIYEQAKLGVGRFQIIDYLSSVFIGQFGYGLDLENYGLEVGSPLSVDQSKC
jgi:hypothetical protein